jgi:predicted transcriptional regulator
MTFLPKRANGSAGMMVIEIRSAEEMDRDFEQRRATGPDPTPRVIFPSYALFHKMLAPNRLEVIKVLADAGPVSIRELARRLGRDFKGVHTDVTALLKAGLVDKTDEGAIRFPFDGVHVDFSFGGASQSAA